jgi:hypothetical protein
MSKIFIFGDSYVRCFDYLNKNPNTIVKSFPSKSASSLYKNEIGDTILKLLNLYKNDIKCILIAFGQVDIHFIYYNKEIELEQKFSYEKTIENYFLFIMKLTNYTKNIYVINILPNTAKTNNFIELLIYAKSISKENSSKFKNLLNSKDQIKRLSIINKKLKLKCKKDKITFLELNKYIILDNYKINSIYITKSPYDLHLFWETFIILILKKFKTCLDISHFPLLEPIYIYSDRKLLKYIKTLY